MKLTIAILLSLFTILLKAQEYSKMNIPLGIAITKGDENAQVELEVKGDLTAIEEYVINTGGYFRKTFRDYAIIRLKKKEVAAFAKAPFLERIHFQFGNQNYLLNDSMLLNNRIAPVHKGSGGLVTPFTGKNVLLGFIDTGIDFTHPDFQDSLGNTRIISIWDQGADTLIHARIPSKFGYGQVWDSASINNSISTHDDDILSHGTNVAGVATGNGMAVNAFKGVAPEASIAMVASDFGSNNWLNTVADGVEYIFKLADSLGMPCVVNISAGTYTGSHDGSDPASLRIDSLVKEKRGRAVVCAAGNLGNLPFHLSYLVGADTNFTWFNYNPSLGGIYFELWADTLDFKQVKYSFGADRVSPTYKFRGETAYTYISSKLNAIHTDSIMAGSNRISLVQTFAEKVGDKYLLQVFLPNPDSNQYKFRFSATGTGEFDIWSHQVLGWSTMESDVLPTVSMFSDIGFYKRPDSLKTIVSSYACLPSVITVGNYINKDRYVDVNNVLQLDTSLVGEDLIPGKIASNSCLGPSRTGYFKPDIAASGDFTLTSNRLASIPLHIANNQADRIALGGMHKRNGGTSMASPVVAGIAALLFEKCPNLNYQGIIDAITTTAYTDSFSGFAPDEKWGFGKVDGFAALSLSNYKPATIPYGTVEICEGDTITVNSKDKYPTYSWNRIDSASFIVVDSSALVYLITTDSAGCRGYSDTVTISLNSRPVIPVIYLSQDSLLTSHPGPFYQWYLNDTAIAAATKKFHRAVENGTYYLSVSDSNNCSSLSNAVEVDSLFSGFSIEASFDWVVYPNPTRGVFTIRGEVGPKTSIRIIDLFGRSIPHQVLSRSENRLEILIRNQPPGIYQLLVENKDVSRSVLISITN